MYPPYIRDAVLRFMGKDGSVISRSSKSMESVEYRAALGEDNKTFPPFKRILMAGRPYNPCNI